MDILIRGMKMPTKGEYHMTLYVCDNGYAYMDVDLFPVDSDRFEVVPVQPHGDLIDRNALEHDAQKRLLICNKNNNQFQRPYEVMRAIALAPTVIPAEPLKEERDE